MRIYEPGIFDQIRRVTSSADQKKIEANNNNAEQNVSAVEEENSRALELLNNKSFGADLDRVEKIKQEINDKQYQINATAIAKGMAASEKRGEVNMGLFGS